MRTGLRLSISLASVLASARAIRLHVFVFTIVPALILLNGAGVMGIDVLSISQIQVGSSIKGSTEQVDISFYLSSPATVNIKIYDPDYTLIRHLARDKEMPVGVIEIAWDERDEQQNIVPDEAYYFSIEATDSAGQNVIFNSTEDPLAGHSLVVDLQKSIRSSGDYGLTFTLPRPARVSIRAGIHEGPLLKTILDWKPLPAGTHVFTWDGLDDTGKIEVLQRTGSVLYLRAMALPEQSILIQGNTDNYAEYHRALLLVTPSPSTTEPITQFSVKETALSSGNESSLMPEYILRDAKETVPVVMVYNAQNRTVPLGEKEFVQVRGILQMSVEVDPLSLLNFQELRYETVLFIDNVKYDEEENVYAPFIYPLDTTLLANGRHEISINLISLSSQVGSYTFSIDVDNE